MAADVTGNVRRSNLALDELDGGEHRSFGAADAEGGWTWRHAGTQRAGSLGAQCVDMLEGPGACCDVDVRAVGCHKAMKAAQDHFGGVLACKWQHVLAVQRGVDTGASEQERQFLLDEFRLPFLDDQDGAAACTERAYLLGHERIDHVEDEHRQLALSEAIGQAQLLHCPHEVGVQATLYDEPKFAVGTVDLFVQAARHDVAARSRHAHIGLQFFLAEGGWWVREPVIEEGGGFGHRCARRDGWGAVGAGRKAPLHMAGANPQFHDDGRVAGLGQFERRLDHIDDMRQ